VVPEHAHAARVQAVPDIPLHRFLGITLVDPGNPAAGICFQVAQPL
jgi:hypothetical protein